MEIEIYPKCKIKLHASGQPDELFEYMKPEAHTKVDDYHTNANKLIPLRKYQAGVIYQLHLKNRSGKLLDVGCADGMFVEEISRISKNQINAQGIDPYSDSKSERVKKISLEKYVEELASHAGKEGKNSNAQKCQVISFLDVLEHFKEPRNILSQVKTMMGPDSVLLIKVPSKQSWLYRLSVQLTKFFPKLGSKLLKRLYQIDFPPPHYYYYDEASLLSMLQSEGFTVSSVDYVSEIPVRHLWSRLWGIPLFIKLAAFPVLLTIELITPKHTKDCILLSAQLATRSQ